MSPFQQATAALSGQVSQIYDCLQRIEAIFHEFENRSKKYDGIFLQCQSVTDLLDKFGQSNKTIAQELKYLEDQFKQHKAGYLPLFADLKKLSMFYQMFAVSYHEMLFEIARRRSEFARMQEIVQKYQAELDAVHQRKLKSSSCTKFYLKTKNRNGTRQKAIFSCYLNTRTAILKFK